MLTIIIPAYNEQDVIGNCLQSLLAQQRCSAELEIIVSANGCTDNTVKICQSFKSEFSKAAISYRILQSTIGNKNNALNIADHTAAYPARLYLDADVTCDPELLQQALQLLDSNEPVYFSGTLSISTGNSFFSNAYGKIWAAMPYIRNGVTGIGCYGVNKQGRALWGEFPKIHSDDKFVRMLFTEEQRKKTNARYKWPVPQGLFTLIKVRTRWNQGNRELQSRFPDLVFKDNSKFKTDKYSISTMVKNPIKTLVFLFIYSTAAILAGISKSQSQITWSRAR